MHQLTISINQILGVSTATSALLSILISALWAIYFNRIKEGQKAEFQKQIEAQKAEFSKQLESIKAKNEKMNYITKTQFDTEFKMYQELSEACFLMFLDNSLLFPRGIDYLPREEEERKKVFEERYKAARDSLILYQNMLYKYAPFISVRLYKFFEQLRELAHRQVQWYPDFVLGRLESDVIKELKDEKIACRERTKEIEDLHKKLIEELREYLQSLKVQED